MKELTKEFTDAVLSITATGELISVFDGISNTVILVIEPVAGAELAPTDVLGVIDTLTECLLHDCYVVIGSSRYTKDIALEQTSKCGFTSCSDCPYAELEYMPDENVTELVCNK